VRDLVNYSADATLKDGTKTTIRAIRPEDAPSLLEAFGKLGQEAIYRRFFSPKKELSPTELKQLTQVDFRRIVALVATAQVDGADTLMAGARYAVGAGNHPKGAELAFLTGEDYQGRGIAGLLLRHLVVLARKNGLLQLEADVLAENQPMLNVFQRSGLQMTQRRDGNVVHVTLSLDAKATT
jgi:RimJ/RimL family protein N-acetyltransferase